MTKSNHDLPAIADRRLIVKVETCVDDPDSDDLIVEKHHFLNLYNSDTPKRLIRHAIWAAHNGRTLTLSLKEDT